MKNYAQESLLQKMVEYLRISEKNIKYSLNLITILFISLMFLALIIALAINTLFYESEQVKIALGYKLFENYIKNGYFFLNLILSLLIIGIPIISNKAFEFNIYNIVGKKGLIITKILTGVIINLFIIFVSLAIFMFMPILIKGFVIDKTMFIYFIRLFLQLNFLYFVTSIIYELTESPFTAVVVILIYFICLINNQNYVSINSFIRINQYLFPVILLDGIKTRYLNSEIYVLLYNMALVFVFYVSYMKKDLKL